MATSNASGDSTDAPVERKHITGDFYYVERWSNWWWIVAGILCFILPPAGIFLVVFMTVSNVTTGDEETVYADD